MRGGPVARPSISGASAAAGLRHRPGARISLRFVLSGAIGLLSACTGVSGETPSGTPASAAPRAAVQVAQIIVKFREPRLDPSRARFLEQVGRDIGVGVIYVRPMSGGAHVLRLQVRSEGPDLDRIIGRLARRPDVEYAEPDRRMRPMRGEAK